MRTLSTFIFFCIFSWVAWGREGDDLIEVPVGEANEQPDSAKAHSSDSVTVITESELQDFHQLSDALAQETSVQIRQTSAWGGMKTLSIRGSDARRTLILIDGVPWDRGPGQEDLWDIIPLSVIERVEVNRSRSPLWSEQGQESVINIVTKKSDERKKSFRLSTEAGNLGYQKWQGQGLWRNSNTKISGYAQAQQADNDFNFLNDQGTEFETGDDVWEKRRHNRFTERTAGLSWIHPFKKTQWQGNLSWLEQNQNIPSQQNFEDEYVSLKRKSIRTVQSLQINTSSHWKQTWQVSYQSNDDRYRDYGGAFYQSEESNRYHYEVGKASAEASWKQTHYSIQGGLKFSQERQRDEYQSSGEKENYRRNHWVLGQTATWSSPSFAWDSFVKTSVDFVRDDFSSSDQRLQQENKDLALGASYPIAFMGRARMQVSYLQQAPTFYELFGRRALLQGNQDLSVQSSTKYELGASHHYWQQNDFSLFYDLSLFKQIYKNKIEYSFNSLGVGTPDNLDPTEVKGVELNHQMTWKSWHSKFCAALFDSNTRSHVPGQNGKRLPNLYHRQYSHTLEWRTGGGWSVSHEWNFRNELYFDSANLLPAKSQETHAVSLSYSHQLLWNLGARVDNIFENRAQEFNGYPAAGRTYSAKFSYQF